MRGSLGALEDFANITWYANPNATLSYTMSFVIMSLGGIPANLLILYLSFFSKEIVGNYKYFLANLAVCDLFLCFITLTQLCIYLYHLLGDVLFNPTSCYMLTFPSWCFGFCEAATLPFASINRYFVICRDQDEWFTKKRVAIICALAYFPVLYPIIDFLFATQVREPYFHLCPLIIFTPLNPEWIVFVLAIYAYPSLIFCNVCIYKKLSKHMNTTETLLGKDIATERSILKALICQAAIPPIVSAPIAMAIAVPIFTGFNHDAVLNKVIFRVGENVLTINHFAFFSYDLNQILNALITLIVVKPYRSATKEIFRNLMRKIACGNVSTSPVIDIGVGGNGSN